MSKLENYKGSITLISGITQKNNGTFPLMEANAILVDDSGTRLDDTLTQIAESQASSESLLTKLDNDISNVSNDLEAEIARAKNVESTLTTKIDNEVERAVESETNLNTKISNEETSRTNADIALQEALESEVTTRTSDIEILHRSINSEITRAKAAESANATNISNIDVLIPNQASTTNQLADKEFVNSSINAIAADFIGNFATKAALDSWQTENPNKAQKYDYAVVEADETHDGETWRYVYQTSWEAQYKINNAPFTAAQNAAINSGATADIIDNIAGKLDASAVVDTTGTSTTAPISQNAATTAIDSVRGNLNSHIIDTSNPHKVTKAQLGLENVDNVKQYSANNPNFSDIEPKMDGTADAGTTTTYARSDHVHPTDTTRASTAIATTSTNGLMSSTDKSKLDSIEEGAQKNTLTGVKGSSETEYRTGNVNITAANIGLGNVDNTSDIDKPISSATQTALDTKYSSTNPPPYPVTSVNGKTGAVTTTDTKVTAINNTVTNNKLKTTLTLSDNSTIVSGEVTLSEGLKQNGIIYRASSLPTTIDDDTADFILVEV